MKTKPSVLFFARVLNHYRVPFHELVRENLYKFGVQYNLFYSTGRSFENSRQDNSTLDWATNLPVSYIGPGEKFVLQRGIRSALKADLVIIGQENALLHNYPILLSRLIRGARMIAFFGHGQNFQASHRAVLSERLKRWLSVRVDWWFAYTERSGAAVIDCGFPQQRVTVFRNAVDTRALRADFLSIDESSVAERGAARRGVFVGGMYPNKRLPYLIDALKIIWDQAPTFEADFIGSGPDRYLVEKAAEQHSNIRYHGPLFGREKVEVMARADVMLMPGLVGLAVLDSFALGKPLVTTNYPWHSPEIDYLINGYNGVISPGWDDPASYASTLLDLINNEDNLARISRNAYLSADNYSIEDMADRFTAGILQALEAGPR